MPRKIEWPLQKLSASGLKFVLFITKTSLNNEQHFFFFFFFLGGGGGVGGGAV